MSVRKSDVIRKAGKVKLHGESPPDDDRPFAKVKGLFYLFKNNFVY